MPKSLLELAEKALLPCLAAVGGRLVGHTGDRWSMETVDFALGDLTIRLATERWFVDVLFASAVDLEDWYGLVEVVELFGSPLPRLESTDTDALLDHTRQFLVNHLEPLAARFDRNAFPATRLELMRIRAERNTRLAPLCGR